MPNYPINHGGKENGGNQATLRAARAGRLWPWDITPEHSWECRIDYADLSGAAATQRTTITIPSAGFVSGRLAVTFTGGGLASPVTITADTEPGDTEENLGDTVVAAIDGEIADDLDGVVASVSNATAANAAVIVFEQGIGLVTVTAVFTPAQQTTVTWGGTLVDGLYSVRLVSASPVTDVTVPNNRAAGTPANVNAMAAAFEAAAEALIGTTLANVLVSADDAGAVNTLVFEPGVVCTVTATVTPNTTHTFGGTETDGAYVTRFTHASLPGGSLDITTTRAAGSPATNTDLADAFEADVEGRALLSLLLASADNTAGANVLTFFPGVSSMDVTAVSAPAPGTLVVSDPTVVIASATPAGPTVTVSHSIVIALNSIADRGPFPHHVMRHEVALEVDTAFGANRTITVGNADGEAHLLGSTPVTLNSTGRSLAAAACTHYRTRYQGTMVPTATIDLGSSLTLSAGLAYVQINYSPHPSMTASAA
jgi:hypothetical protein